MAAYIRATRLDKVEEAYALIENIFESLDPNINPPETLQHRVERHEMDEDLSAGELFGSMTCLIVALRLQKQTRSSDKNPNRMHWGFVSATDLYLETFCYFRPKLFFVHSCVRIALFCW